MSRRRHQTPEFSKLSSSLGLRHTPSGQWPIFRLHFRQKKNSWIPSRRLQNFYGISRFPGSGILDSTRLGLYTSRFFWCLKSVTFFLVNNFSLFTLENNNYNLYFKCCLNQATWTMSRRLLVFQNDYKFWNFSLNAHNFGFGGNFFLFFEANRFKPLWCF